jgi:hypothetical protein
MEPLALTTDVSALLWTALATIVFLLVPGVVYSYYVLARWIDDDSYAGVMATVERRHSRTGS